MKGFNGHATAHIHTSSQAVFDRITAVDRLPEWNAAIESVMDKPEELGEGAEWTVKMHPRRLPSWKSISRVERFDARRLRFVYLTRNADGNPSYVRWSWDVVGDGDGTAVTVSWDCHLLTLDRRLLAGPMRRRQLAREVPASLTALAEAFASAPAANAS